MTRHGVIVVFIVIILWAGFPKPASAQEAEQTLMSKISYDELFLPEGFVLSELTDQMKEIGLISNPAFVSAEAVGNIASIYGVPFDTVKSIYTCIFKNETTGDKLGYIAFETSNEHIFNDVDVDAVPEETYYFAKDGVLVFVIYEGMGIEADAILSLIDRLKDALGGTVIERVSTGTLVQSVEVSADELPETFVPQPLDISSIEVGLVTNPGHLSAKGIKVFTDLIKANRGSVVDIYLGAWEVEEEPHTAPEASASRERPQNETTEEEQNRIIGITAIEFKDAATLEKYHDNVTDLLKDELKRSWDKEGLFVGVVCDQEFANPQEYVQVLSSVIEDKLSAMTQTETE